MRILIQHLQVKFTELFVPEQELPHNEAMIKYFGKSDLKHYLQNKPICFGLKAWILATMFGYVD
jgi:hypothetical protein